MDQAEAAAGHLIPLAGDWALWIQAGLRTAGLPADWLEWFAEPDATQRRAAGRILAEPEFAAALIWQNPRVNSCFAADSRGAGAKDGAAALTAKRAAVIARYAQRYCAKNDTIGFFGPVCWARLDARQAEPLRISGDLGIRSSAVYFEYRVIHALADAWIRDPRLLPHLTVRMHTAMSYDGAVLRQPYRFPARPGPAAAAVLDAVDGTSRFALVVRQAAVNCGLSEGVVAAEAISLRGSGVLDIGFRLPVDEHPERWLRGEVAKIADASLRDELLGVLDQLDLHRSAVAAVVTDPEPLAAALGELETFLTKVTASPAVVTKQEQPTGRTPVYLDCRGDLDVVIGAPLIDRLRAPLAILLDSLRWFTSEVALAVEAELASIHQTLLRRGPDVALCDLYFAAADVLAGRPGTGVHDVLADFQLRWGELLAPRAADDVHLASEIIAAKAARLFPADRPGWTAARYHCPDLMLCRPTGSAPLWVLGELHIGMNTLESRALLTQSDDPSALRQAVAADMAVGRIVPCYPAGPVPDARRYPPPAVHLPGRYLNWSYAHDAGHPEGSRSLPGAGLFVCRSEAGLAAGPHDGGWQLPVLEFFGEFLSALVVNRFALRPPAAYSPRIVIDDLVVGRRSWQVTPQDPGAALSSRGQHRVADLADWLRAQGMPRYLFARSPLARKPFYVDLDAPLMVRNLSRVLRALAELPAEAAAAELSEMLPAPGDLWLADPRGRHRTAEFRFVAVDTGPAPDLGQDIALALR
jgi:hypothetical protein